ncbi:MAG: hypothetical protein PVJ66_01145 [Gammaproteobacteria bacterium]|jgi:hypothetical protein
MIAGLLCCLLGGCTVVGPAAIKGGRLTYNEVIGETNNQQMLMAIIKNRYTETGNLLAVASVTANVSVTASAGFQLGFGGEENYSGNLVPFSAGTVYEENPTVSYTPVAGAKYARKLFSPVPISDLAQLTGTMHNPVHIYNTLVSNINGIQNPAFLHTPEDSDPRFSRIVAIMAELTRAHHLRWTEAAQKPGSFSLIIDRYAPAYTDEVGELLTLLGLSLPMDHTARVVLPVYLALDGRESGGIGITTRSIGELMEILSAAIEIPAADQRKGVAASYPSPGLAGRDLRIHHSVEQPEDAAVAVEYRDYWFYIDQSDQPTKRYFRMLGGLWSVTIAESARKGAAAPVLTVPVSR